MESFLIFYLNGQYIQIPLMNDFFNVILPENTKLHIPNLYFSAHMKSVLNGRNMQKHSGGQFFQAIQLDMKTERSATEQ